MSGIVLPLVNIPLGELGRALPSIPPDTAPRAPSGPPRARSRTTLGPRRAPPVGNDPIG
jgi:hypothetical protein